MSGTDPMHAIVGPLEHREFARDFVRENPAIAIPALAVGTPLYTAAKAIGVNPGFVDPSWAAGRSPASLDEVFAGYQGLGEGIRALLKGE